MTHSIQANKIERAWKFANRAIIVVGIVLVVLLPLTVFWIFWDALAVLITAIYTRLVFNAFFFEHPKFDELLTTEATGIALRRFRLGTTLLVAAALIAVAAGFDQQLFKLATIDQASWTPFLSLVLPLAHVLVILWGCHVLLLANEAMANGAKPELASDLQKHIQDVKSAIHYCDRPTRRSFCVITLFIVALTIKAAIQTDTINEFVIALKAFIAGAVCFQLLISNYIYGLQFASWRIAATNDSPKQ